MTETFHNNCMGGARSSFSPWPLLLTTTGYIDHRRSLESLMTIDMKWAVSIRSLRGKKTEFSRITACLIEIKRAIFGWKPINISTMRNGLCCWEGASQSSG